MTEEKYLAGVKANLREQEQLHRQAVDKLGAKSKHTQRILRRVELLKIEIDGMENP
jgi:hypothetical protein